MQRYAITDRRLFAGSEAARRAALIAQGVRLAGSGVDYLQIREKDLPPADLLTLTRQMRDAVVATGCAMRLVLNGPAEIAEAAGVGLHLPFDRLHQATRTGACVVSVSCHSTAEIVTAREHTELLLFAPVFEKSVAGERVLPGRGLTALTEACAAADGVPVFALGGVTESNAAACIEAGASGIAAIRMFL